jgi:hypothetical protein
LKVPPKRRLFCLPALVQTIKHDEKKAHEAFMPELSDILAEPLEEREQLIVNY